MRGKSTYLSSSSRKTKGKFAADWNIWPFYSLSKRNCSRQVWFSRSWEKLYAFGPDVTSTIVGTWVYRKSARRYWSVLPRPCVGTTLSGRVGWKLRGRGWGGSWGVGKRMGSSVKENGMDLLSSLESSGIALGKHVFFLQNNVWKPTHITNANDWSFAKKSLVRELNNRFSLSDFFSFPLCVASSQNLTVS